MAKTYTDIDAVHPHKRKVLATLIDDAANMPCIRCGKTGETRRCHYNGFRGYMFGKGRGIKANNIMTAEFCQECDDMYSEANYHMWPDGSKSIDRSEDFLFWIAMTNIRRANAS